MPFFHVPAVTFLHHQTVDVVRASAVSARDIQPAFSSPKSADTLTSLTFVPEKS